MCSVAGGCNGLHGAASSRHLLALLMPLLARLAKQLQRYHHRSEEGLVWRTVREHMVHRGFTGSRGGARRQGQPGRQKWGLPTQRWKK